MKKLYYVITLDDIPIAVTDHYHMALKHKIENETKNRKADVIPVVPLEEVPSDHREPWAQIELDFEAEDPTDPL